MATPEVLVPQPVVAPSCTPMEFESPVAQAVSVPAPVLSVPAATPTTSVPVHPIVVPSLANLVANEHDKVKSARGGLVNNRSEATGNTGADPQIWGASLWKFLHAMAANYPDNPGPQFKAAVRHLLFALRHLLPCAVCRKHYQNLLFRRQPTVDSAESLQHWMLWLHNEVNQRLGNQPPWTMEQIRAAYKRTEDHSNVEDQDHLALHGDHSDEPYEFNEEMLLASPLLASLVFNRSQSGKSNSGQNNAIGLGNNSHSNISGTQSTSNLLPSLLPTKHQSLPRTNHIVVPQQSPALATPNFALLGDIQPQQVVAGSTNMANMTPLMQQMLKPLTEMRMQVAKIAGRYPGFQAMKKQRKQNDYAVAEAGAPMMDSTVYANNNPEWYSQQQQQQQQQQHQQQQQQTQQQAMQQSFTRHQQSEMAASNGYFQPLRQVSPSHTQHQQHQQQQQQQRMFGAPPAAGFIGGNNNNNLSTPYGSRTPRRVSVANPAQSGLGQSRRPTAAVARAVMRGQNPATALSNIRRDLAVNASRNLGANVPKRGGCGAAAPKRGGCGAARSAANPAGARKKGGCGCGR